MKRYNALVAGAGPAGIAVVGTLLDFATQPFSILWVDPLFTAGHLSSYSEVPSNTKVNLFLKFTETSKTLKTVDEATHACDQLRQLPGDETCCLRFAANMCQKLTQGLCQHPSVQSLSGRLDSLHELGNRSWQVRCSPESEYVADMVFLCTGSHPRPYEMPSSRPMRQLPLLTGLTPSKLSGCINRDCSVVVVGNSHSSTLVLKNLYELSSRPSRVIHYARAGFKYAEFMDGWILHDNTGLKGIAAEWAKKVLDHERVDWPGYVRVNTEAEALKCLEASDGEVWIIPSVGFMRGPIPSVSRKGQSQVLSQITHDPLTGILQDENGFNLRGVFGYGIAFPEQWTDPYGNVEHSVGLWKFMRYLRRVIPGHLKDWDCLRDPSMSANGRCTS